MSSQDSSFTPDREKAAKAIHDFLDALGIGAPSRPELRDTGARVVEAWLEDFVAGYAVDVEALVADSLVPASTGLVVLRHVPLSTMCPHHLLPASGTGDVAFAPRDTLIGIGTIGQVLVALCRRLALQEDTGEALVDLLWRHLKPDWVAAKLTLSHACVTARSGRHHGALVESFAFRGDLKDRDFAFRMLQT